MPFLETLALIAAVRAAQALAKSLNSKKTPPVQRLPSATRPEKVITFVGATNSGKSSTINALLGHPAFLVGQQHGTSQEVRESAFVSGYRLRDTPGIMDSTDYSRIIWEAVKSSELVIFTVTEELFRQELEMLQQIRQRQQQWDSEAASIGQRLLALFVNKEDVKKAVLTEAEHQSQTSVIYQQVSAWIPADRIVFGSAAPVLRRAKQSPDIVALQTLISAHIAGRSGH